MADTAARPALTAQQYLLAHPCRHYDLEFGERVENKVGELSPEDCADLYHCVEAWFQKHGPGLPPPPGPMFQFDPVTGQTKAHVCDMSCPWLIHNTVYYCCWSGAFHNCTTEACEYTETVRATPTTLSRKAADRALYIEPVVQMRDSRACRITGNAFALSFGISFEQSGFQQSDHRRATRVKSGAPSAKAASKWTRQHGFGGDALCTMSPEPSPSPTATPSPSPDPPPPTPRNVLPFKLHKLTSVEERLLVTAGHINQFMHPPGLEINAARALAAEILNVGEKMAVTATAHGFQFPQTYTPMAHVMTLLTCMATGAEVAHGRVFLPFHIELVGKLLPLDECIRRTGERNQSKQHTEWNTLLGTIKRAYCRNPPPEPTVRIAPLPMHQLRAPREYTAEPYRQNARALEGSAWLQSLGASAQRELPHAFPQLLPSQS